MWPSAVLLAGTAGILLSASSLAAQPDARLDPADPPPVTWCAKPALKPKWERQPVSLLLEITAIDSSEAHLRLRPYLPFLLSGIAEQYAAEHQPSRDVKAETTGALPHGEPRYGPADLERSLVLFDLLGNGTIDSIIFVDSTNSVIAADLMSAILAASARGDVFGPYADSTVRTRLGLFAGLGDFTKVVSWPAFTLYTPISRPASADPKNPGPRYPSDAMDWVGELLFRYQVNEHGRAVPGSVSGPAAENRVWESDRHRQAYEQFRGAVEAVLPRMRFTPAEMNGCYITSWVQQSFIFQHAR